MASTDDVTHFLGDLRAGNRGALDRLLPAQNADPELVALDDALRAGLHRELAREGAP